MLYLPAPRPGAMFRRLEEHEITYPLGASCPIKWKQPKKSVKELQEKYSTGIRLRFKVLMRDKFTCQYCGRKAPEVVLEVDHVFPQSKGGKDEMDNLVVLVGTVILENMI